MVGCTTRWAAVLLLALAGAQLVHSRTWVYTFVPADHGGDLLLPHFINYYHQLGFTYRRFLVLVHHTPGAHPRQGLERVAGICQGYALECRFWEAEYTPDGHMEQQLLLLRDYISEPLDWIINADVDELQEWPTANINEFLMEEAAATSMSYVTARIAERTNAARAVAPALPVGVAKHTPSLFDQFPLACSEKLAGDSAEPRRKVVAFKNNLRPARGGRRVVPPDAARSYFSPCVPGQLCPRASLRPEDMRMDMFNLTPYAWFQNRYRYVGTPKAAVGEHHFWPYKPTPPPEDRGLDVVVHRFGWTTGGLSRLKEKLERYAGDCRVERAVAGCRPLTPRWKALAASWRAMKATRKVDTSGYECEEDSGAAAAAAAAAAEAAADVARDGGEGEDAPAAPAAAINTAYMGLAWEEFESRLKVESKVRNKVKGDSQARLAGLMHGGGKGEDVTTRWDEEVKKEFGDDAVGKAPP